MNNAGEKKLVKKLVKKLAKKRNKCVTKLKTI
jgi:hypothetical protein